jgi:hypothetical protein
LILGRQEYWVGWRGWLLERAAHVLVTSMVVATHLFGVAGSKFGINNSLFFPPLWPIFVEMKNSKIQKIIIDF